MALCGRFPYATSHQVYNGFNQRGRISLRIVRLCVTVTVPATIRRRQQHQLFAAGCKQQLKQHITAQNGIIICFVVACVIGISWRHLTPSHTKLYYRSVAVIFYFVTESLAGNKFVRNQLFIARILEIFDCLPILLLPLVSVRCVVWR